MQLCVSSDLYMETPSTNNDKKLKILFPKMFSYG